jgi:hypothetical protein
MCQGPQHLWEKDEGAESTVVVDYSFRTAARSAPVKPRRWSASSTRGA